MQKIPFLYVKRDVFIVEIADWGWIPGSIGVYESLEVKIPGICERGQSWSFSLLGDAVQKLKELWEEVNSCN